MNPNDRITIRVSHATTIEFYREYVPRTYKFRSADQPRLNHIFNSRRWVPYTYLGPKGLVEIEFSVRDRELPEPDIEPKVAHDDEFWAPLLDLDLLESYYDQRDTMNDLIESTRS